MRLQLVAMEVAPSPSPVEVEKAFSAMARGIVEAAKRFPRWMDGTCVQASTGVWLACMRAGMRAEDSHGCQRRIFRRGECLSPGAGMSLHADHKAALNRSLPASASATKQQRSGDTFPALLLLATSPTTLPFCAGTGTVRSLQSAACTVLHAGACPARRHR